VRISLRAIVAMLMAVCCAVAFADAVPDRLGEPIDLSSFSEMDSVLDASENTLDAGATPIVPVDSSGDAPWIRPYVTGIVGASFGTINAGGENFLGSRFQTVGSVNDTIFTGGGAIGMALARPSGLLRMEVEGRARGPMSGQTTFVVTGSGASPPFPIDVTATNGWSAMTNLWRDYFFNDRFGMYGGGGFGVGGYEYSMFADEFRGAVGVVRGSSAVNTFAWQVGTGFTYQLSERVTFDTGYRFFAMSPGSTQLQIFSPGPNFILGSYTSAFSASELLLSVRIYEPFRNWR
jgi:opacity protein-like surface antigen